MGNHQNLNGSISPVAGCQKGTNCIKLVLEGAFHIDVTNFFSDEDKNSKV